MAHAVLEAGSAALAAIIDELARVQRVSKCTGCECFLAVVRAIDTELAPMQLPQASGFRADLRAWLEQGQTRPHGCLGCAVCLPVEPYNQFVTRFSRSTTRTDSADEPTCVLQAAIEPQEELQAASRLDPFLSVLVISP